MSSVKDTDSKSARGAGSAYKAKPEASMVETLDSINPKSPDLTDYVLVPRSEVKSTYIAAETQSATAKAVPSSLKIAAPSGLQLRARSGYGPGLGLKPFKVKMWQNGLLNTDGSGVCAAKISLDVTGLSEFSPLAALFDEFRVLGGKYTYVVGAVLANSTTSLPLIGCVGFDPDDGVTPSANTDVCQLAQHQIFAKPVQPTGTIALTPARERTFAFTNLKRDLITSGQPAAMGTSSWQPTNLAVAAQPAGYLVVHTTGTASVTAVSGMIEYHVEFRSRK